MALKRTQMVARQLSMLMPTKYNGDMGGGNTAGNPQGKKNPVMTPDRFGQSENEQGYGNGMRNYNGTASAFSHDTSPRISSENGDVHVGGGYRGNSLPSQRSRRLKKNSRYNDMA